MKTILLIEGTDLTRESTTEILELAGYAVLTAKNGKEGISKALMTRPDLVVCDIMMPALDGYGVLHIFNQNPQLAGVPFIFLTATTERADLRKAMERGADDYLTKPFEETELLNAIAGRLSRVRQFRSYYDLQATDGLGDFLEGITTGDRLAGLTADRRPHTLRKKQELYTEGDEAIRLYYIQAGRIKTIRRTGSGKELITGVYGPGDFVGYLPLLQGTGYTDSAMVLDDATLYYIPKEDFRLLMHRNPLVSQQFVRLLAGQVDGREKQMLSMAYNSLRRRVADTLLQLHEQAGGTAETTIQFSRDDLASVVGTAPESLIRTLSEFKQNGLIEQTATGIHILLPEKLRRAPW